MAVEQALPLTFSGNEITDLVRANARLGLIANGGMVDDWPPPDGSVAIRRAATNLHRHGQCDSTTDYSQAGGGTTVMSIDATTPARFGPQTIKLICNGGAGNFQGCIASSAAGQAAAAGTLGVGSMYFKGVAGLSYSIRLRWTNTDTTTTFGATATFNATGDLQLCVAPSLAVGAGLTGDILRVEVLQATANRAETLWFAHPMLEKGQFVVAPYVPTSGGVTATHPASRVQAPSTLLDPTRFGFVIRLRLGWSFPAPFADWRGILDWGGSDANSIQMYTSPASNTLTIRRTKTGGTGGNSAGLSGAGRVAGNLVTLAAKGTATDISISLDGAPFVTAATDPSQTPTRASLGTTFDIGTRNGASSHVDSDVFWAGFFGGAPLTDADIKRIHDRLQRLPEPRHPADIGFFP